MLLFVCCDLEALQHAPYQSCTYASKLPHLTYGVIR